VTPILGPKKETWKWLWNNRKPVSPTCFFSVLQFPSSAPSVLLKFPQILPKFHTYPSFFLKSHTYPSLFVTWGFKPRPPVTYPYNLRSRRRIIDPISVYHNCTMVWDSAIIIGSPDRLSAIKHTQTNLAAHSLWRCLQCQSITKLLEFKTSLTEHNHR
jgi:hypothetical protein